MNEKLIERCVSVKKKFIEDKTENGRKIFESVTKIVEFVDKCRENHKQIENFAGKYDLDELTPANGYRSFLSIFDRFLDEAIKVCSDIDEKYGKFYIWKSRSATDIFVISQMIENLFLIGKNLIKMHEIADEGQLFAKRCHPDNIITRMYSEINQECFYGRFVGFHVTDSLKGFIKYLAMSASMYSEYFYSDKKFVPKLFDTAVMSKKYLFNPELSASNFTKVMRKTDISFYCSFMRLVDSRMMHKIVDYTLKKISVARTFEITPEALKVHSALGDKLIDIPIPLSHIGFQQIKCRLLSSKVREGMLGVGFDCTTFNIDEPCDGIIIHAHGGGFISQSSKFHETYLREWALTLDVPILSIDYSLAPEAAFPRAIEEIFYVYGWILKYGDLVGTTAKNIILCGDSAGGNILTAVLIKIIEMKLPKPSGLFTAYTPFIVNYVKSPSRMMGFFDAFLNVSAIMTIFGSYVTGEKLNSHNRSMSEVEDDENEDGIDANLRKIVCEIPQDYLISPYWCPDEILCQFPPTRMLTTTNDPCIDDGIEFCKRLRQLKVDTNIRVLEGLIHGFLNAVSISKESQEGSKICMEMIAELLDKQAKDD